MRCTPFTSYGAAGFNRWHKEPSWVKKPSPVPYPTQEGENNLLHYFFSKLISFVVN